MNNEPESKNLTEIEKTIEISNQKPQAPIKGLDKKAKEKLIRGEEIQMIIYSLHDVEFASKISEIKEIQNYRDIHTLPDADSSVLGVINLRNKIIAIIDMHKKMGLTRQNISHNSRIIIVEYDNGSMGFVVDSVAEVKKYFTHQIQKPTESLSSRLNTKFIEGVIIDDERVIIVLNLIKMFKDKIAKLSEVSEKIDAREVPITKDQPVKPNIEAPRDKAFKLPDGSRVRTLKDLAFVLSTIDKDTYDSVVGDEHNNIFNWIKDVFNNVELANNVQQASSREDLLKLLNA